MNPHRRYFSARERAALYLAADGKCTECGTELGPGWHADHVDPHCRGGDTDVINGQALCPPCNLKKGDRVDYIDTFQPRPFQAQVVEKVLDNHASGVRSTVVLASPGAGKTITSQAAACELYRADAIDHVVVLVPRVTLAEQCEIGWRGAAVREPRAAVETDWSGDFALFDRSGRIDWITHTRNRLPLLPPGPRGRGIVSTYSSVVSAHGQTAFESFAQQHAGRFLLVADEAQFCGAPDDHGDGTRAGGMVEMLHHYAAHTLLMTGTPYRSDGQPLILAEYGPSDAEGLRPLITDVESTYQDGVREGYLRKFEATFINAKARRRDIAANTVTEYELSDDGSDLGSVVRQPDVWQPIADAVVAAVRDKQRQHPEHRGLISCMEMREARAVHNYLRVTHPGLRVSIAVSDDRLADATLAAFKTEPADVLVTVRKAFIGYDCKSITVVGVLTHYRDSGHLMQLVGRGLRYWDKTSFDAQSCRIVAPDDPKMQDFIKVMRQQLDEGMRERRERQERVGEGDPTDSGEATSYIESATATGMRKVSNDVDLDVAETSLMQALAREHGISDDLTKLHSFISAYNAAPAQASLPPETQSEPAPSVPAKTVAQRVEAFKSETSTLIGAILSARGIYAKSPAYSDHVKELTIRVNKRAGYTSATARTEDQHRLRRDAARHLRGSVS